MYPIILEFGIVTVFSIWLFVAVGFVAGCMMFAKLAKRNRVKWNFIAENSFKLFIWTFLVSRFTYIVLHFDLYFYNFTFSKIFDVFAIWDKGFSFWGAAAAWTAAIIYLAKKYKEPLAEIWDITAPSLLFGMFFGNIGAFLDGANYGKPTELPWGVVLRSAQVKYISEIHPTQLYAAAYTLAIALFLIYMISFLRDRIPGFIAETGAALFCIMKFIEEFFRGDETAKIFSLRLPQIMALAGIVYFLYLIRKRYTNADGKFFKKRQTEGSQNYPKNAATATALQNQTI